LLLLRVSHQQIHKYKTRRVETWHPIAKDRSDVILLRTATNSTVAILLQHKTVTKSVTKPPRSADMVARVARVAKVARVAFIMVVASDTTEDRASMMTAMISFMMTVLISMVTTGASVARVARVATVVDVVARVARVARVAITVVVDIRTCIKNVRRFVTTFPSLLRLHHLYNPLVMIHRTVRATIVVPVMLLRIVRGTIVVPTTIHPRNTIHPPNTTHRPHTPCMSSIPCTILLLCRRMRKNPNVIPHRTVRATIAAHHHPNTIPRHIHR